MKEILNSLAGTESKEANTLPVNLFYATVVTVSFILAII